MGQCIFSPFPSQSRAQGLVKQFQDIHEQIEQTYVEFTTFDCLRKHEIQAIPKRLAVRTAFFVLNCSFSYRKYKDYIYGKYLYRSTWTLFKV